MGNCIKKTMKSKSVTLKISVVIPVYNMDHTIRDTIKSVLNQTYKNFEIIVQDNNSQDSTFQVVKSFPNPRIKYFKNNSNVGYAKNLIEGKKNCRGDILYFLGADDILSKNALQETSNAFMLNDEIGAVTRPYFWFQEDINKPNRVTPTINNKIDEVIYINDPIAIDVIHNEILGQLSGLAFRMKYLKDSFFTKESDWIAHGYPFLYIFKKYPIVFLKNYQVAIRIGVNVIRQKGSSAYNISPTKRWINMLNEVFYEKKFQVFKNTFIQKTIASNYLGLIQIKNYSGLKYLLREIGYMVKFNWLNVFNLNFWFYSLGCIVIPSSILIKMTDYYKNNINRKFIKKIAFEYKIN